MRPYACDRWGASCFAWGEMLWVVGGTAGGGKRFADVWRFNPLTRAWAEAEQGGGGPAQPWGAANGFDRAAVGCGALLAFGEAQASSIRLAWHSHETLGLLVWPHLCTPCPHWPFEKYCVRSRRTSPDPVHYMLA